METSQKNPNAIVQVIFSVKAIICGQKFSLLGEKSSQQKFLPRIVLIPIFRLIIYVVMEKKYLKQHVCSEKGLRPVKYPPYLTPHLTTLTPHLFCLFFIVENSVYSLNN